LERSLTVLTFSLDPLLNSETADGIVGPYCCRAQSSPCNFKGNGCIPAHALCPVTAFARRVLPDASCTGRMLMTVGGETDGTARSSSNSRNLTDRAAEVARWCAVASIGLGALVLAGWVLDVAALKSVHPLLVSMKANTAACFVLASWALWAKCRQRQLGITWRRVAQVCAAMVANIGAATLTEYFFGWSLGIDELLFQDSSGVRTSSPGRMSPATAIEFVLVGAALLALDIKPATDKRPAQWLALAALGIALVPGTGYLYGVDELYSLPGFTSMAPHTACGLLILSVGTLLSRPDAGLIAPILDDAEGARVARRLLPAVVLIPLGLGWLRVLGQRAGLYETGFGTAFYAVANVGCLVTLTWWASTSLIQLERARERVLQEVAVREESLARTVESIGDAVIATDTGGRIDRMNPVAEELTGWRARDARGQQLADVFRILNEHTRSTVEDPVSRVLREGKVVGLANHTVLMARDGTEHPIADSAAPIKDGTGKLMGVVLVFRDQTAERSAEVDRERGHLLEAENRRIHEASRLKGEFLANMSHELRTPLNSVIGFAELLHDGEVGAIAPKQKEFLADILSNGRHLLQLINDVLDLSKVAAGKLEFHPEPVDLRSAVAGAISTLRTSAATKRIGLETSIAPDIGAIVVDPSRLKQILLNYLSNAIKFTAEGGRVIVRASRDGDTALRLEVEDTGVGIAAQDIARLFVAFQQLDAGTAKKHGGTGLGLALTKHLAEAQGGSVGVRSTLGEGSTFHVVLPRQPIPPAPKTCAVPSRTDVEEISTKDNS
jgi:PAS domain S-box-containing protein